MTCETALDFLRAYLDDELPAAQRALFDEHLAICESCVNYLRTYQATIALERSVMVAERVAELPDALVRAILAALRQ